jgi:REP element-mobilizing transposase RayT
MARHNRIHFTGAVVYVVVRGRKEAALLTEQRDFERFQSLVGRALVRCRARLLAYCWLPNAAHLVIRLSDVSLETLMRHVCGPYSRYLHQERGLHGPVYQSRYRVVVIDADLYLLPLLRYVHVMPVAAGLCLDPSDYPWTSHRAYRNGERIPWLAKAEVLAALELRDRNVARAYRALMSEPQHAWIATQFEHGSRTDPRVAGGAGFVGALERKSGHRLSCALAEEILAAVSRWQKITPDELFARSISRHGVLVRSLVAWHVLGCGACNLAQLAQWFGVRRWTLRAAIERHRVNQAELFNVPLTVILAPVPALAAQPGSSSIHVESGGSENVTS